MALPTDGNAPLNNPSHLTEHQRVSDSLALLNSTPWIALPFGPNFSQFAGFELCAYRKLGDVVQFQGLMQGNATGNNQLMATMPVGYRPKRQQLYMVPSSAAGNVARVDTNIDGTIILQAAAGLYWYSISGLWYSTIGL